MALLKENEESVMTGEELFHRPDLNPCELVNGGGVPLSPTRPEHGEIELDLGSATFSPPTSCSPGSACRLRIFSRDRVRDGAAQRKPRKTDFRRGALPVSGPRPLRAGEREGCAFESDGTSPWQVGSQAGGPSFGLCGSQPSRRSPDRRDRHLYPAGSGYRPGRGSRVHLARTFDPMQGAEGVSRSCARDCRRGPLSERPPRRVLRKAAGLFLGGSRSRLGAGIQAAQGSCSSSPGRNPAISGWGRPDG
jgi:hypothetical protein